MSEPNEITKEPLLPVSDYQSVWHFCLLSICSLGMYPFFWFFKHWQYLKDEKQYDISPSFRAAFTIYFGYDLFNQFELLAIDKGYKKNIPLFLLFICYLVFTLLVSLKGSLLSLCVLFSFVFLIPIHRMMNFYYLQAQPNYVIKQKLSKGEKRFLLYYWLVLIGFIILGNILP